MPTPLVEVAEHRGQFRILVDWHDEYDTLQNGARRHSDKESARQFALLVQASLDRLIAWDAYVRTPNERRAWVRRTLREPYSTLDYEEPTPRKKIKLVKVARSMANVICDGYHIGDIKSVGDGTVTLIAANGDRMEVPTEHAKYDLLNRFFLTRCSWI